ncbi:MAG TPA: GNAT family N-acetyltransferase [Amycolatopsis sp.]|nr:GNAT family N-acetyltransferase [Amycolatopsis sp.]
MATDTAPTAPGRADAYRAATRAGVRITPLRGGDVGRALEVLDAIWGPAIRPTEDFLRALTHAGAALLAAEPLETPVTVCGYVLGFLGWQDGVHLHSHQLGVLPAYRARGVGYALKLAERAECLGRGITRMRWTFDPLLARNAAFNFGKLGVVATGYVPDLYGRMSDVVNGDDATDRFEVVWSLDADPGPPPVPQGRPAEDAALIEVDGDGVPHRTDTPVRPGVRVPIPADYDALRRSGAPLGRRWRRVAGDVFAECFAAGLLASSFGPDGYRFTDAGTVREPNTNEEGDAR